METQPRSLNTLYKLLWEQIKDSDDLSCGLCIFARDAFESDLEQDLIMFDIQYNMPERWYEAPNGKRFKSVFGWDDTDLEFSNNQRKEFVQRMIKETELSDTNVRESNK